MKFQNQLFVSILFSAAASSEAFSLNHRSGLISAASPSSSSLNALPSPSESAKALTTYMAKAHEEKLKALKELEKKKDAEIKALKEQIASTKSSSSAITLTSSESSKAIEDMTAKLNSYQKFISNYIIKAQEDKAKAVKAAEEALIRKYEDKMKTLMLNAAASSSTIEISQNTGNVLFDGRNANVIAAANAGKSRWGDKEVQKIGGTVVAVAPKKDIAVPSVAKTELSLYDKRNMFIANAAKAGKQTRWGYKEEKRAVEKSAENLIVSSSSPSLLPSEVTVKSSTKKVIVSPEIEAADHGLRSDGGVGGPSLAERVSLGTDAVTNIPSIAADMSLYDKRNMFIANAAKAGKQTRWGDKEEKKAIANSLVLPSSTAAKVNVIVRPEVEAADHGLRSDGGVGGPTLAERVNLGARILQ